MEEANGRKVEAVEDSLRERDRRREFAAAQRVETLRKQLAE